MGHYVHESPGAFSYLLVQPQAPYYPRSAFVAFRCTQMFGESKAMNQLLLLRIHLAVGVFSRNAFQCDRSKEKDQALEPVSVQGMLAM